MWCALVVSHISALTQVFSPHIVLTAVCCGKTAFSDHLKFMPFLLKLHQEATTLPCFSLFAQETQRFEWDRTNNSWFSCTTLSETSSICYLDAGCRRHGRWCRADSPHRWDWFLPCSPSCFQLLTYLSTNEPHKDCIELQSRHMITFP